MGGDNRPLSSKYREIQRSRLAQPGRICGVIPPVIAGNAVDENVQSTAMVLEPRNQLVELSRIECELTAPMRMGTDEFLMHAEFVGLSADTHERVLQFVYSRAKGGIAGLA